MGNLITDALVDMSNKHSTETAWADAAIAVWASGGIRSAIDKKPNRECSRKYGVPQNVCLFHVDAAEELLFLLFDSR